MELRIEAAFEVSSFLQTEYVQGVMSHSQEPVTPIPTEHDEKDLPTEPELETEEPDDETYQEVS